VGKRTGAKSAQRYVSSVGSGEFPGAQVFAPRHHLLPISMPPDADLAVIEAGEPYSTKRPDRPHWPGGQIMKATQRGSASTLLVLPGEA
jgi:hypothetical protein